MVRYIWANREVNLKMKNIVETDEYKQLLTVFPGSESLLKEALADMLNDVNKAKDHGYIVQEGKIGYKE